MTKKLKIFLAYILFALPSYQAIASTPFSASPHFQVLPLGTSGGELEDNLSSYLVAPFGTPDFLALDAGTLCSTLKKIPLSEYTKIGIKASAGQSLSAKFLTQHIKAYLISHAHLDHISGLAMCAPIDSHKEILGSDSTIDRLRDYIFNWQIWPNFADEGQQPTLKQYHYHRLNYATTYPTPGTGITIQAFPLNHGGYPSTAFLLESKGYYLLYFGDTGADSIEHSQNIEKIWLAVAPLIREHKLTAIFIEASYLNDRPNKLLFGHLRPDLVLAELNKLAEIVNPQQPETAVKDLTVVVTHIKQGLENHNAPKRILEQLNVGNHLGVKFIVPEAMGLLAF